MSNVVVDFLYGLERATCLEECFSALVKAVEALDYDAVAYTAIPQMPFTIHASPVFLTSSGFSTGFLKHYTEANWVEDDFTVERIVQGDLRAMNWADELQSGRLTGSQIEVIETAQMEYGLRNAISIPTQSDKKLIAGASIVSEQRNQSFQILQKENLTVLKMLVRTFHDRVFMQQELRKQFYIPLLDQFSDIEIKLMKMLVGGHRLKMSEERCGISPTRAGNVLSSLYKRLDISNASEFAYLVGLHELVEHAQ